MFTAQRRAIFLQPNNRKSFSAQVSCNLAFVYTDAHESNNLKHRKN